IKSALENQFPPLWVEGELSNLSRPTSGHVYFTLKDEYAQIRSVVWREIAQSIPFEMENGMHIIVSAKLSVYEKQGQYQLYVEDIQPVGIGKLELAFQQLKEKLFKEGLFDEDHKKPVPEYPQRIGIVTSPTGAALKDFVNVISRRFPGLELVLYPVRVQGEGAAEEIAEAIRDFNQYKRVEVLVLTRGGGSLEDLWAFNEEKVARAIFSSRIPVVSAVGHQIDFTIADFVADMRAPTPSAAAEILVKDRKDILESVRGWSQRMAVSGLGLVEFYRQKLATVLSSYGMKRPRDLIRENRNRLTELSAKMGSSMHNLLSHSKRELAKLAGQLNALSPLGVLERGYSICYKLPEMKLVRSASGLKVEDEVEVLLWKGRIRSQVKRVIPN
ncbi:MAG: exodeoxyribonuclease VII large subunit, partial [candidate division Zixibacteria bacterium]|nr:exodeoxyribonuclease VII large subunit [candidate division Zixibacteria bacterium]